MSRDTDRPTDRAEAPPKLAKSGELKLVWLALEARIAQLEAAVAELKIQKRAPINAREVRKPGGFDPRTDD